jgi:1-aminocyclopropane-1-carboxylate deaminase/D-cysteine desulfhydrase-like pyridoxal-dependent ACC family enzyme
MDTSGSPIGKTLKIFPDAHFSIPTPIHHLKNLSEKFSCNIFIKREDLTGFGLGGNKVRKLDFLIADALQKRADTLICKSASSFTRNAAVACKAANLELHVCINGERADHNPLSRNLFRQMDTTLHYTMEEDDLVFDRFCNHTKELLKDRGKRVLEFHPGGSDKIGTLGYVKVFGEICDFSSRENIHFDHIIHPAGSAGTAAGLIIGQSLTAYDAQMVGVAISQDSKTKHDRIIELAMECSEMIHHDLNYSSLKIDDQFIGSGYPIATKAGRAAVELFADSEGVFLDQVYTGKAAAGMIHYIENEKFKPGDNILFIHTGGNGGLYY